MIRAELKQFAELFSTQQFDQLLTLAVSTLNQEPADKIAMYYHVAALHRTGDAHTALEHALSYLENLPPSLYKGKIAKEIGVIYWNMARLNEAEQHYEMAMDYFKHYGDNLDIASILNNKGIIYDSRGDYDTALQYYKEALEYKRKSDNPLTTASTLTNISILYHYLEDYDISIKYAEQAYELFRSNNNIFGGMTALFYIFSANLRLEQADTAEEVFERYKNLNDSIKPDSHELFPIAEAMLLKAEQNLSSKVIAMDILKEIIAGKTLNFEYTIHAIQELIEILMIEFRLYGQEEVIEEIDGYLEQMLELALQSNLFPLIIDIYIIKIKLAEIRGRFDLVESLFDDAEKLLRDYELDYLKSKLDNLRRDFDQRLDKMRDLLETNSSMLERAKQSELERYLKSLKF